MAKKVKELHVFDTMDELQDYIAAVLILHEQITDAVDPMQRTPELLKNIMTFADEYYMGVSEGRFPRFEHTSVTEEDVKNMKETLDGIYEKLGIDREKARKELEEKKGNK